MTINLKDTNIGSFEPVPSARYEVEIETAELTSSKSGKAMIKLRYKILEGDMKGRLVFDQIVLVQTAAWKLKTILSAVNSDLINEANLDENKYETIVEELINKRLSVYVETGKNDQGQTTFNCSKWLPSENAESGDTLFG